MNRILCFLLVFVIRLYGVESLAITNIRSITKDVVVGYNRRVAADPAFVAKSITEAFLAAGTQFVAEWNRRGSEQMIPEIDFVIAGVLTAVVGKYYSMWKTAKTKFDTDEEHSVVKEPLVFGMQLPTNAFQKYMLDGRTKPTYQQRIGSLIAPIVPLFRAGCVASLIGYGITAIMIQLRLLFIPSYVSATQNVNIIYASLYTGGFMAIFSNLRYQILQGVIEPLIEFYCHRFKVIQGTMILLARLCNGFIGSVLAISGMRLLGLQRLK